MHPGRRRAAIVLTILVVVLVLITFAPTYIARYVMGDVLKDFGIDHEGVDTLRIYVWKREAWIGPVRFRGGEHEHGQLGHLGVKIRLLPFAEKHALIERVIVEGIDIVVTRAEDNTIELNGIALQQFLRPDSEPEPVEEDAEPWGAGLTELELRDSRLIFNEKTGGVLTVEVDRLRLGDFMTWLPDEEGSFELEARVNDIEFAWTGRIRPFAQDITLAVEGQMRGAELAKLTDFTGDFGLQRQGGVVNTTAQHGLTLRADGQVEGTTVGQLDISEIDYAKTGVFSIVADRLYTDLDIHYALSPEGDFELAGHIASQIEGVQGTLSDEQDFKAGKADVEFVELDLAIGADKAMRVATRPSVDLEGVEFDGRIHLSMAALLDVLNYLQSLSSSETVTGAQTGLGDWSDGEATLPKSDIKIAKASLGASVFDFNSEAGNVSLNLTSGTELTGIEVTSGEQVTTFDQLKNELDGLELRSGGGELTLRLSARTDARGGEGKGPNGVVAFERLENAIEEVALEVESGRIAATVSANTALLSGAKVLAHATDELPEASASVNTAAVNVKNGAFGLAAQQMTWQGEAEVNIADVAVEYAKGEVSAARMQRLELRGARANQDLQIATESLTISGLDVSLTRRFIDGLLASTGETDATAPVGEEAAEAGPSQELVKEIQQALAEQGYDPGPVDGQMGARTRAAIRDYERNHGLPETGQATEALLASLRAGPTQPASASPVELKFGRVALLDGARVRFHDATVEPNIKLDTVIDTLELSDVDTTDPNKLAQAKLQASINEFTRIGLDASASALGSQANLDAKASIEELQLHVFSPYSAEFGGVYFESGQFTTFVDAKAKQGALDGTMRLDVLDLVFEPLSEKDAKRLSDQAGFPVETAVSLLQDKDGRIQLNFPISGTVLEPDVDISSAINKAIGSTLQKVFPPTLIGSMLSSVDKGVTGGLQFEPIKFEPGSAELDKASQKYLEELAQLLQNQPKLNLKFCGRATVADLEDVAGQAVAPPAAEGEKQPPPQDEKAAAARKALANEHGAALRELAVERTKVVRRYLITEKGIESKRIAECRITFDAEDTGPPRVQVSL
ncbi:MAG: hypothetical protein AMS22_02875 [Thiotrichales bacterium SG8_50]|nr:MAG: hypothetical protein AMS22_02875 [Thiotrichales bacterium SG8_50]